MLVGQKAPDDGRILDHQVEGDRAQGTDDANHRLPETEAVQREGLKHSKDVHVDADAAEEGAHQIHDERAGQRVENREDDVRR